MASEQYMILPILGPIILVIGLFRLLQIGRRDSRMPKGPPTLPIIGNAHQIPKSGLFRKFRDWAQEYGPVFSLKVGPANVIVLCDRKAIHKLLVEKGNIYSDRPESYVGWLLTKGDHVALQQMTPEWRERRKIISHAFSPKNLDEKHFRVQEAEATVLMTNLLSQPEDFYNQIKRYTASVASSLTYGFRGATYDSFWAHGVYEVMDKWTPAMEPGANPPVDEFKFLRYIPAFMAHWKRRGVDAGQTMDRVWGTARRLVDERRAKGIRRDCVIDNVLDEYEKKGWPLTQHGFNNLMGEFLEGGADTTTAQLLTLVLAFAKNPHVQAKARQEIDAVCGTERSPRWTDFSQMPYINCIVKEGQRWRPVAVTALPHRARVDDEYEGMLIPKDSTLFIPVWALHHTESLYTDPETFNPDRFLGKPKLANDYAGSPDYENRDKICPGIHLAERNMWRIAAKLLWAFEFQEPLDPVTKEIRPLDPYAYNPGILQAPLPFEVRIKPRSQAHIETIKREAAGAVDLLSQFE
ncbi:cytochrome P450 [Aspergillus unguis]